jgi:tetratricopeptide (TPR) repeat protein
MICSLVQDAQSNLDRTIGFSKLNDNQFLGTGFLGLSSWSEAPGSKVIMQRYSSSLKNSASRKRQQVAYLLGVSLISWALFCNTSVAQSSGDSTSTASNEAVEMSVKVHLRSADSSRSILVENRIWNIPLEQRFSGFLANMLVELNVSRTDSIRLSMKVFLTTVGSRPDSRTRRFNYELGLPAKIPNLRGKAGATYEITFTPNRFITLDASNCEYNHREGGSFSIDPTANFDLYYVKNSLGDYHWNKVKELLESEYRPFKKGFDITHPGKINYYLYPCATATIAWDPRFAFAIDPTRSQTLGLYNHDYMAPAHLIATLTQVMRVYGYAPPFLAEGISSYFYFFDFEALSAVHDSVIIPLKDILTTQGYYGADPILATAQAGSFCRFLADTYGIDRFRRLYQASDDLTIADKIKEIYQADVSELESRWVGYLLKLKPSKSRFAKRARLEGAGNNISMAITVMQRALAWDSTFSDTLITLAELAPYYSEAGEYDVALRTYQTLFSRADTRNPRRAFFLLRVGYLQSLLGDYKAAAESYRSLMELDTNLAGASEFNLARLDIFSGDTTSAIDRLQKLIDVATDQILMAEAGITLGMLLGVPGKYNDPAGALEAFERAESSGRFIVKNSPGDGVSRFRLGVAYLGLGEYDLAHDYLNLALFLEFRPRFLGRELVALGNLADIQGDRKLALDYYHRADSLDQSVPGQNAASIGLKRAFKLKVKKPSRSETSAK